MWRELEHAPRVPVIKPRRSDKTSENIGSMLDILKLFIYSVLVFFELDQVLLLRQEAWDAFLSMYFGRNRAITIIFNKAIRHLNLFSLCFTENERWYADQIPFLFHAKLTY